jgi:hypothetical protein
MSARVMGLLALALSTSLISNCALAATAVDQPGGFWPGLADGFLILFKFLGGYLEAPGYFERLHAGTSYYMGYLSGALAFASVGALASRP